jgi:peptidyl-prolyl cis-trans isomerase C
MKTVAARRGACVLGLVVGLAFSPAFAAGKDPVLAKVNGADIHESAFEQFQGSLPPQMRQAPYAAVLNAMVNNKLLDDAARKEGLQNDPDVKRAVHEAEEVILRKAWMAKKLDATITDAILKQGYDQYVQHFKPEEEVHARHILVDSEDLAKSIIADLKSGANFEDLAKAKSKDPSAQKNGGDIGYFTKSEMVPEFAKVAFSLKPGEISPEPVKTQFGWHVIQVEDRRQSSPVSFEEAKPMLRQQAAEQLVQQLVGDLRAKAQVSMFNPDGSPLVEQPAPAAAPAAAPAQ